MYLAGPCMHAAFAPQTEHVPAAGGPAAVRAQRPEAEADVHACMRGPAVNHFKSS